MLNPDNVSINNAQNSATADDQETISVSTSTTTGGALRDSTPLILNRRRRFFSRFFFPTNETTSSEGYVEFGNNLEDTTRTLGTFSGVFSPVALSMFSSLLFLRVGFITGNAGLLWTLALFFIAYLILVFTVCSICAVSTNGAVEGGGAYFMISRTLGPEFGGSIGTLFFVANIVSSALYLTGCAEGLIENFGAGGYWTNEFSAVLPDGSWWRFFYCSMLNTCNLFVCLTGAAVFAKTSAFTLSIVSICLLSVYISFLSEKSINVALPRENTLHPNITSGLYTGLSGETLTENLYGNYTFDYTSKSPHLTTFAAVFAVLFSGVTGIMAGANMSGELKDPSKSIPKGTLGAVAFTFTCYILLSVLTAATTSRFLLQNNYVYLLAVNIWPPFITIGILLANFSASLSNFIGSSRILEALAKDNVYGIMTQYVVKGTLKGNPIAAVITSFLLIEVVLLIGNLNLIAQINSVLFLLSYLAINLACLGLELASAPNFRPAFTFFSWHTALIGLGATLVMMFVINYIYALLSICLCLLLFILLHLFSPSRKYQWGSISQALIFHQVRKYLLLLDPRKDHVRFWRPQILLLVNNPRTCCPLITFVNDIKKGGLYVLGHVQAGQDFLEMETDPVLEDYHHWLALVDHLKVKAFIELTVAKTVREGFHHLVRVSGMGAMKPNTIFLGFYDEQPPLDFFEMENPYQSCSFRSTEIFKMRNVARKDISADEYVGIVADVFKMKKNICICRHFQNFDKLCVSRTVSKGVRYVDVWPINFLCPNENDPFGTTSLFMFQLACILNMVPGWKKLRLRVFLADHNTQRLTMNENRLKQLLNSLRINAHINVMPQWENCWNLLLGGSVYTPSAPENSNRTYLQQVNSLIRSFSELTACLFIYLPMDYGSHSSNTNHSPATYLQYLNLLTNELPPTVLVHGVHGVTSTTL